MQRKNNLFIGLMAMLGRMGLSIIAYPFFIKQLSPFDMSIYLLFVGTASFYDILDFNFTNSLVRYFSYAEAGITELRKTGIDFRGESQEGDNSLFYDLFLMAKLYYKLLCVVCFFLITVGFAIYLFFFVQQHQQRYAYYLINWLIYSGTSILALYFMYLSPAIISKGQIDSVNKIALVSKTIGVVIQLLMVHWWGLLALAGGLIATVVVERGLLWRAFNRHTCGAFREGKVDLKKFKALVTTIWHNNYKLGLIALTGVITVRASFYIAGWFIDDLSQLSAYLFTCQVIFIVTGIAHTPITNNYSDISYYIISDKLRAVRLFLHNNRLSIWLMIILAVLLAWLGDSVLRWLNLRQIILGAPFLPVLLLVAIGEKQLVNHATMITVKNEVPMLKAYIISAVVILIMIIVLGQLGYKIWALILPQLVVQAFYNYWYWPRYNMKFLGISAATYWRQLLFIKR